MTDRSTCWALTINNPTPADEEAIALARQKGWKVEGQLEKGEEGTPHYQLMVKTPQVRFAAVKKAFPRAHIEVARNHRALSQYVSKQDTRLSELPKSQEKYPSLSKLWDLIFHYISAVYEDILGDPSDLNVNDKCAMELFDDAIRNLITRGYFVESLAVNPQVRSSWKQYRNAIFYRSYTEYIRSQSDRQTPTALESEVSLPVIDYNHADDNPRKEGGLQGSCRTETTDNQSYEESPRTSYEGSTEGSDSFFGEEDD